jgi:hypothetical protein
MENIFNAQTDGILMLLVFVDKLALNAEHGMLQENAKVVIQVM